MKIELNYDPATGQISDNAGCLITCWVGLEHCEVKPSAEREGPAAVSDLIQLKETGFTADEIIAMKGRGVI
jgi:hypothetical protein